MYVMSSFNFLGNCSHTIAEAPESSAFLMNL